MSKFMSYLTSDKQKIFGLLLALMFCFTLIGTIGHVVAAEPEPDATAAPAAEEEAADTEEEEAQGEFLNPIDEIKDRGSGIPGTLKHIWETFTGNITYLISLIVVIGLFIALIHMRKVRFDTRMIAQIGLVLALSLILDMLKVYRMPQGGSITIGAMVPLFIIALAYGAEVGLFTGFLFGVFNMLLGGYIIHPLQMFLDYPLAFMCMGLIAFFPKNYYLGAFVAMLGQTVFSTLSGVIFFSEYAGSQNPWVYSFVYNATFVGINLLVVWIIMTVLPMNRIVHGVNREAPVLRGWSFGMKPETAK